MDGMAVLGKDGREVTVEKTEKSLKLLVVPQIMMLWK